MADKPSAKYTFINPNSKKDTEKILHSAVSSRLAEHKFSFQQPVREIIEAYDKLKFKHII